MRLLWIALIALPTAVASNASYAAGDADGPALLMRLVARSNDAQLQLVVLRGVYAALEGRRNVPSPAGWSDVYAELGHGDNADLRTLARQPAASYGDKTAIAEMQKTLEDARAPIEERRVVLRTLLAAG